MGGPPHVCPSIILDPLASPLSPLLFVASNPSYFVRKGGKRAGGSPRSGGAASGPPNLLLEHFKKYV